MQNVTKAVLGLCAMLAAYPACSADSGERVFTHDGVSYTSGGIGVDSQERLNARSSEFNLKLVFTLKEGNYLADVGVEIKDAAGRKLVEHNADGPFFLARLPAGSYTVTAVYEGKPQTRHIRVGGAQRVEYFRWPSDPGNDFVGLR
jgi:hypothetical protein